MNVSEFSQEEIKQSRDTNQNDDRFFEGSEQSLKQILTNFERQGPL